MIRMFNIAIVVTFAASLAAQAATIPDVPFVQEYAERAPIEPGGPGNDVRDIAVAPDGRVVAATKGGVYVHAAGGWTKPAGGPDGPAFTVYVDAEGSPWVGAWDGIYTLAGGAMTKARGVEAAVSVLGTYRGGLIALGPDGFFELKNGAWKAMKKPWSRSARDMAVGPDGDIYVPTHSGLQYETVAGHRLIAADAEVVSTYLNDAETGPDGRVWVAGMGGIDVFEHGARRASYGTAQGLPNYNVQCLAFDTDGRLWAGTELGVARFDGETWSLRHTLRWLPSDDVRAVAFDAAGTAWIATSDGVGLIKRKTMTLADKAAHYEAITRARHVRPPGLVEKCKFPDPNDFSTWEPVDDDNDGSYTAFYMAAECWRYAVTKDPEAKQFADEAFDAVAFLHEVTGGQGFVARTVVPSDWATMHDMNETFTPQEAAERRVDNPRFKKVESRWRLSEDGKWYWKGDTSSDETVGHFYAFNMYYHFVADEAQKARVRKLCKRFMDYIIQGDYTLIDPVTGSHTLWGMWNPERLNHDPEWRVDAPINCTEMLSFLRLTQSLTGEGRYGREFTRLYTEEKFGERLRRPKSYGRTERTHIDDDLLSMVWPTYILNEKDPEVLARVREGLAWEYSTIENDVNPFFNFVAAWGGVEDTHNDESVAFLRDTPLDLRQFSVDSSKREDVGVRRYPMLEEMQTDRILPPSERGTMRWDKNPWAVFSGDFGDPQGHLEAAGTYWLLPYWLGRYVGIIGAPETK